MNHPLHSGSELSNFEAGSPSNQFDMNNNDLPVRHRRQMPFPVDDNNTVMGKIGGTAGSEQSVISGWYW